MHARWNLLVLHLRPWLVSAVLALCLPGAAWGQIDLTPTPTPTPAPAPTAGPAPAQPEGEAAILEEIRTADFAKLKEWAGRAEQLMKEERFEEALGLFSLLAQRLGQATRPDGATPAAIPTTNETNLLSVTLAIGQARALGSLGEDAAALEAFENVMSSTGENFPPTLIAMGEFYLDRRDPYSARTNFEKALQTDRRNPQALIGLARSLILASSRPPGGLRELQLALKPLTKVVEAGENPYLADAYQMRGSAYGGLFMFDKALADMAKSIEIEPNDYETYFQLGIIQLRKEDPAAAVDAFAKSIEHYKPKKGQEDLPFTDGPNFKAQSLIEVGKHATDDTARKAAYQAAVDECQQLLAKLDEKSPLTGGQRAGVLVTRGIAERMLNQMGTSIRTLSQAIELDPTLTEAYFRRGICLQQIGENRMALADFRQAATNYSDPRGNLWEGFVYAKLGNYHEAIRAYGDAIAASDRYTPAYINRGLAYMMLGENEKAVENFNDAIRIEPTNGDYYFKRGVAYVRLDQLDKAKESLATAIEFDPSHREAYRSMADVLQKLGHANLAEEYRNKGAELEKKPGAP